VRAAAKNAAVRFTLGVAHTSLGRRTVRGAMRVLLKLTVDMSPDARLSNVREWPDSLRGFEDLSFVFTSTQLDNGIAQLTIEEAAHLFRTARDAGPGTLVEIGRYKGGSTLVLATAMHPGARLVSYDLHAVPGVPSADFDRELRGVLERYGLGDRVELVVGDSHTAELPGGCVLVFVDGDHSLEGVLADYEHWKRALEPGGHLLFHDAPNRSKLAAGGCEPVGEAIGEIERRDSRFFRRVAQADSIADFVRTDEHYPDQPPSALL
jgi:predicted O-methyltransferase YrrM